MTMIEFTMVYKYMSNLKGKCHGKLCAGAHF